MSLRADPKEVAIARSLVGRKALLLGGGGAANEFSVVKVLGVREEEGGVFRVRLHKKRYYGKGIEIFDPYLYSWYVRPLPAPYARLPLGNYYAGFQDQVYDADKIGFFGTLSSRALVRRRGR